jgi:hypothetical protein
MSIVSLHKDVYTLRIYMMFLRMNNSSTVLLFSA